MWSWLTKLFQTPTKEAAIAAVVQAAPTILGNAGDPLYRFHRSTRRGARVVAKIQRELAKGTPESALVALRKELRVCEAQAKLEQIKLSETGEV